MKNCTCDKLECSSDCLCECHRSLVELNRGLDRIDEAVDKCISNIEAIDENIYRCCLCRKDCTADELDEGFDVPMCSKCARDLDHYGCE